MLIYNLIVTSLLSITFAKDLPNFDFNKEELNAKYWNDLTKAKVFESFNQKPNVKRAKNIILFLGDGMGISTVTPARILKGQLQNSSGEESKLVFEEFPYISLIKTYNVDAQTPDSAGTATAFLCGVKTNIGVIGVSANVKLSEPNCDVIKQNSLSSIFKWAQDSGRSTGVVTTTRITHATPAAGYTNIANRDWEGFMSDKATNNGTCKDIARQLVENEPGSKFNVILGGGNRYFYPPNVTDPITGKKGQRKDGQNLVENWLKMKEDSRLQKERYQFVSNVSQLNDVDYEKIDYLFGLFNYDHISYDMERDPKLEPSLEEMTDAALNVLKKNDKGFVLLVEGGRIDHSHHDSYGNMALYETLAFDKAIETALNSTLADETLIVVTADHSHTLTMNGYPERGHNIMGIADKEDLSGVPFTTMIYGNGPGYQINRTDPTTVDTSQLKYRNYAAIYKSSSNHAGEDVALYSVGPMAHLFRGTQEQTYVAHTMAFAACIGDYQNLDHCQNKTEEPELITTDEPESYTTEKPVTNTTKEPESSTTDEPESTTTDEPESSTTEKPGLDDSGSSALNLDSNMSSIISLLLLNISIMKVLGLIR